MECKIEREGEEKTEREKKREKRLERRKKTKREEGEGEGKATSLQFMPVTVSSPRRRIYGGGDGESVEEDD